MVGAPFIMNFMLPVPDASFPAVEICSEIGGRDDPFGHRDVVIRRVDDLQQVADLRICINNGRHIVDQTYDFLCHRIARRGLAAEDRTRGTGFATVPLRRACQ